MAETILYRIPNWEADFENNRSRTVKNLLWVILPNKHDSEGYLTIIEDHPNGPAHYACWVTITQVASRCQPRGTLVRDDGRPYDAKALARRTRISADLFAEALPRLVGVGWLVAEVVATQEVATQPDTTLSGACQEGVRKAPKKGREGKGNEGKGKESSWRARKFVFTDDDMEVAKHIWRGVQRVAPEGTEPNLKAWANDVRLIRERDNRTHEAIRQLFDWANADSFWATNILSPSKLRKQWTQLSAKKGNRDGRRTTGTGASIRHDPENPVEAL